jgi:hypothetical protein
MSYLASLVESKERHVATVANALRSRSISEWIIEEVERIATDAFIAGARANAATEEAGKLGEVLAAMEFERRRHQSAPVLFMLDVEPGKLIKMALHDNP